MSSTSKHIGRIVARIALAVSVLALGVVVFVVLNRQYVTDQLAVWSFTPSNDVKSIVERTKMTPQGSFAFYATEPEVAASSSFNQSCPRQESASPILGCYTSDGHIYIYDVTNTKLAGIEEVTSVHELLHAIWQRQSASEKEHLSALLQDAYARIDDTSLKEQMAYYQRVEPDEIDNELHSILGTEVMNLPSELEQYYSQYFDRSTVLALHGQYSVVYTALRSQSDSLYTQLEKLSQTIDAARASYQTDYTQLSYDIDSFNSRATAGSFSSTSQFYAERNALIARSNNLDARRVTINDQIDSYMQLYAQYQDVSSQLQNLNNSLDSYSTLQQAPSV